MQTAIIETVEVFRNAFSRFQSALRREVLNESAYAVLRHRLVQRDPAIRALAETLRVAPALVDPSEARLLAREQVSDAVQLDYYFRGLQESACERYEAEAALEVLSRALARLAIAHIDGWLTGERTTY